MKTLQVSACQLTKSIPSFLLKPLFILITTGFCVFSTAGDLENIFVDLNEKINPGVVSISVTKKLNESLVQLFPGFYMPKAPSEISGAGSGFVIDPKGIIVTNSHVVSNVDKIEVQFLKATKRLIRPRLLGRDKLSDIAVLKGGCEVPSEGFKTG